MTIMDNMEYIGVLLYAYYTTIIGRGVLLTLITGVECLQPSGCDRNMEPRSSNWRGLIYRSVEEIMSGSFGLQGQGSQNGNNNSMMTT